MWIQLIVSIFALVVAWRIVVGMRQGRMRTSAGIGWLLVWLAVLLVFWTPELASRLADFFGIGRGADLIIYVSIVVLTYLLYRVFVRMERMEREITQLTRELAIHNASKQDQHPDTDR